MLYTVWQCFLVVFVFLLLSLAAQHSAIIDPNWMPLAAVGFKAAGSPSLYTTTYRTGQRAVSLIHIVSVVSTRRESESREPK